MFVICDATDVVQDMASIKSNLARGLSCLGQDGHLYKDVDSSIGAWIGDHFDGTTLVPDSSLRAEALAEEQETDLREGIFTALRGLKATLETDVGELTLADIERWGQGIENVAAATTPAEFAQRWARYEKKRTLLTLKMLKAIF